MRDFQEIYDIAAERKGGENALESLLSTPLTPEELRHTFDDRWLARMAKAIFQAGYSWKEVEGKWPAFEVAFDGFHPVAVSLYGQADMDRLMSNDAIVPNEEKIAAVIANARFVQEIAKDHGSLGAWVATWPETDHAGLVAELERRGSLLGGTTGQRVLRMMGRDGFVLTEDVRARLLAEGVLHESSEPLGDMAAVQTAFNGWMQQSGRGLSHISHVLAYSI